MLIGEFSIVQSFVAKTEVVALLVLTKLSPLPGAIGLTILFCAVAVVVVVVLCGVKRCSNSAAKFSVKRRREKENIN